MTTFQKVIKYLAMGFAIFLTVFIITIVIEVGISVIESVTGWSKDAVTQIYTYECEDIKGLEIEMGVGDLVVNTGGDKIVIEVNEIWGFELKEEDQTISIETGSKKWGSSNKKSSLVITVPEDYVFEILDISMGVGSGEVLGINAKDAVIETGVGSFKVERMKCEVCRIEAGVGEVKADFAMAPEDCSLVLEKGIGEVKVNGESYKESEWKRKNAKADLNLECGIGSIKVTIGE